MEGEHWLRSRMKFSGMEDVPALAQEKCHPPQGCALCQGVFRCRLLFQNSGRARDVLNDLAAADFRISDTLTEDALRRAGE